MEILFGALFAGIPNEWFNNNAIARYEGYYASVFYAYFASLGLDIVAEESSNARRLDMAVRFNGQIHLFEFKVVELISRGRAPQQIKDRGYADKCAVAGQPIHLIGVEFSRERRTLAGFEVDSRAVRTDAVRKGQNPVSRAVAASEGRRGPGAAAVPSPGLERRIGRWCPCRQLQGIDSPATSCRWSPLGRS